MSRKILILTQHKIEGSPPFLWYEFLLRDKRDVTFVALFNDFTTGNNHNKWDLIKNLPRILDVFACYDVVWSFHPIANFTSRIVKMFGGKMIVVNELRCLKSNIKFLGRVLDGITIKIPDLLVANSYGVRQSYSYPLIKVVYGGVPEAIYDGHIIKRVRSDYECRKKFKVVFVGRLVANKGIKSLCSIFSKMDDYSLHVYGDGPLRCQLEQQFQEISFHGYVPHQVIFEEADILVNNSNSEGMSKSILEAASLNIPILMKRIPSNNEVYSIDYPLYFDEVGDIDTVLNIHNILGSFDYQPLFNISLEQRMEKLKNMLDAI